MLCRLHQFVCHMEQFRVSDREYAHLRALCLFSPGWYLHITFRHTTSFHTISHIVHLPDGAPDFLSHKLHQLQSSVVRSLRAACSSDDERAACLLLQLPVLRTFSGSFIEDVFFVGFVGDVSIDDVIPCLLNAER